MISEDEDTSKILLQQSDFPDYYINMIHPNDYLPTTNTIIEKIFHKKKNHNLLLLRMSFKIYEKYYIPMTFVCDTGAPGFIYLSKKGKKLIEKKILTDELDNEYIVIGDNKKILISDSPNNHSECNIIGLRLLQYFELKLTSEGFDFEKND
jgi:hypothetical protein